MSRESPQSASLLKYDRGQDGLTPLHAAASRGHVRVLKELLDRGALVNKASPVSGESIGSLSCTHLYSWAARFNFTSCSSIKWPSPSIEGTVGSRGSDQPGDSGKRKKIHYILQCICVRS